LQDQLQIVRVRPRRAEALGRDGAAFEQVVHGRLAAQHMQVAAQFVQLAQLPTCPGEQALAPFAFGQMCQYRLADALLAQQT